MHNNLFCYIFVSDYYQFYHTNKNTTVQSFACFGTKESSFMQIAYIIVTTFMYTDYLFSFILRAIKIKV